MFPSRHGAIHDGFIVEPLENAVPNLEAKDLMLLYRPAWPTLPGSG